jgi:transposase
MDQGMVSEKNLAYLRTGGRRYIVGTPRSQLKRFERELLKDDWKQVRNGLEVKQCLSADGGDTFILCRSAARAIKEKQIHQRFETRIEQGLTKLAKSCRKKNKAVVTIERRVGKLLGANSRAAGLFRVHVRERTNGSAEVVWKKLDAWQAWAKLSEGCYLLRSNIKDWDAEQLWQAYLLLTEAEAAFRIQKSDLGIRPVWHQKKERVQAHILVCFLAYVLWKMLGQMCRKAGLGNEPRKVLDEITQIKAVDVVMPTKQGAVIRNRCITRPTEAQSILLQELQLHLPQRMKTQEM